MTERYYLQKISQYHFLVRELQGKESGEEDRIVKQFEYLEDASDYADAINVVQRNLDEKYGRWICNAV